MPATVNATQNKCNHGYIRTRPTRLHQAPAGGGVLPVGDTGDPFCARGANLSAHLDYTQKYNNAASAFVTQRLNAAGIH
jgi:hypothetical protein